MDILIRSKTSFFLSEAVFKIWIRFYYLSNWSFLLVCCDLSSYSALSSICPFISLWIGGLDTFSLPVSCWFSRVRAVILACRAETRAADAVKLCSTCQHTYDKHTFTGARRATLRTTSYLVENKTSCDTSELRLDLLQECPRCKSSAVHSSQLTEYSTKT